MSECIRICSSFKEPIRKNLTLIHFVFFFFLCYELIESAQITNKIKQKNKENRKNNKIKANIQYNIIKTINSYNIIKTINSLLRFHIKVK